VKTRHAHRASRPVSERSGAVQRRHGQRADPAVMSSTSADRQAASDPIAALAKALGLSEAKVQAAIS